MLPKVRRIFSKTNHQTEENNAGTTSSPRRSSIKPFHKLPPIIEDRNRMDRDFGRMSILGLDHHLDNDGFIDDLDESLSDKRTDEEPHWINGPRDITTLPDIISSTYSDNVKESDYAVKQMLAILETLTPVEEHLDMFEKSLRAIEFRLPPITRDINAQADWVAIMDRVENDMYLDSSSDDIDMPHLSDVQLTAVFDALPFLFETVTSFQRLKKYQDVLSMMVVIALSRNSMIRRQCISAINILLERHLLTQDFLRICIMPGLFFVYKSGVGAFQSNDLRMETVQALCQIINFDSIRDRKWVFDHFVPKYSLMLKDSTMHVRKSALQIFGKLGNMFGAKFTEVFLVPHLIILSYDMTWAVRKVACEIFVKVAECATLDVRVNVLSPNFTRLLSDPNKWVSFVAYQQLGPFIALFADPNVTGLEIRNGEVHVRDILPPTDSDDSSICDTTSEIVCKADGQFDVLPEGTYFPDEEVLQEMADVRMETLSAPKPVAPATPTTSSALVKTPKKTDRMMDSVISGFSKILNPFDRTSSPKSASKDPVGGVSFSGGAKRSPLSLHGAVSLMDKWSRRNNPNNPQRFSVFDDTASDSTDPVLIEKKEYEEADIGIAAKCSSTDDLTKLGLEDGDEGTPHRTQPPINSSSLSVDVDDDDDDERRTSSPRGRRVVPNAWSKLDTRQKLFLRRLGALPPSSPKKVPKRLLSPRKSPIRQKRSTGTAPSALFTFAPPTTIGAEETNNEQCMTSDEKQLILDDNDSDDEDDLDKSFVSAEDQDEDVDEMKQVEPESTDEKIVPKSAPLPHSTCTPISEEEPISNEFTLSYWSSNYATVCIDNELKPFGSSSSYSTTPFSLNYLESRFDVMKVASPRTRSSSFGSSTSPLQLSPRRKAHSSSEDSTPPASGNSPKTSESVAMLNTEEKEKLGILDIDEMNMSMSSNSSIIGDTTDETEMSMTSSEAAAFEHVPPGLVDSYMDVIGPPGSPNVDPSLRAEIFRYCAYNFPAVCFTLGRPAWPRLKHIFAKLALDEQTRVRQSICNSIHEIAKMLGEELTDSDLLPIFEELRNDQSSDVRSGILSHLYDFIKCLSLEKRAEMIHTLPSFFPIGHQPGNQQQNGEWRSRCELIAQLTKLCTLYDVQNVNHHMSGIALTLADDRVAEVRREAVNLVATIVGLLVKSEWEKIRESRDIDNGFVESKQKKDKVERFLSEQFVDDIVSSFAKTQKWTRRQTFCFICTQVLKEKHCDGAQFRYFFANPLRLLVTDKVPNVRLASCEALNTWKSNILPERILEIQKLGNDEEFAQRKVSTPSTIRRDMDMIQGVLKEMIDDEDIDVAYMTKKFQGLTTEQEPIDVDSRTNRMRQREEKFFGDLVITDSAGQIVRVTGDSYNMINEIRTAPIEKMTDIDRDIEVLEDACRADEEVENILEPPMISAAPVVLADDLSDNLESVDMEIDPPEDVEGQQQQPQVEIVENSESTSNDVDVPMDPAPSPKKQESDSEASPVNSPSSESEA